MTTHRARHATPRLRRPSALAAFVLLAAACQVQPSLDSAETDVQGDGFRILHLGRANTSSLNYTIDVGSKESDVYVVFTNPGGDPLSAPELHTATGLNSSVNASRTTDSDESLRSSASGSLVSDATGGRARAISGTPMLRDRLPPVTADTASNELRLSQSDNSFEVGTTHQLLALKPGNNVPETEIDAELVAKVTTADERFTVHVWEELDGNSRAFFPENDEDILDDFVEAFLEPKSEEHIFGYVTDIFGSPWGDHEASGVLPPDTEAIHILLSDINDVGFGPDGPDVPWIAGYFWALDTWTDAGFSNKLMITLHGPALAQGDSITDRFPGIIALTAAHELQHLIHYYHKSIVPERRDVWSDTWLDEMMSLLAEEYVSGMLKDRFDSIDEAEEAFLENPRGINPSDLTANENEVSSGRLPLFNYWNMRNLVYWPPPGSSEVLRDYATSYAFGAWLTRNFGGVRLMGDILNNRYLDQRAVTAAVSRHARDGLSFVELLERWGASVVLSDRRIPVAGYRYRASGGFSSSVGDTEVTLGSIDLHNYRFGEGNGALDGPWYYTSEFTYSDDGTVPTQQTGYSNVYYKGPQGVTGNVDLEMSASADTRVSIIIKERLE